MTWRAFYSYSHQDEEWRKKLGTYLKPLVRSKLLEEWHDRKIQPGADWNTEISEQLAQANLIFLLVSEEFLASDYCFGVEVETAMARVKEGTARVVPILLKPCLWDVSPFSNLQMIPRDARPIFSWPKPEEGFWEVAREIQELLEEPPPAPAAPPTAADASAPSLQLVREQVRAYAHLYERIRQRMRASNERTRRLDEVFAKMRQLAAASHPMLDELAESPSPGERLAAVAILQVFASERHLSFLARLVGSEKPFVGYHAINALRFSVGALHPRAHGALLAAIEEAKVALTTAEVAYDTERQKTLQSAERELRTTMAFLAGPDALGAAIAEGGGAGQARWLAATPKILRYVRGWERVDPDE